jgi:hypothetical protein
MHKEMSTKYTKNVERGGAREPDASDMLSVGAFSRDLRSHIRTCNATQVICDTVVNNACICAHAAVVAAADNESTVLREQQRVDLHTEPL